MAFTEIELEKEGKEEIFTKSLSKLNNKMKTIPNKSNTNPLYLCYNCNSFSSRRFFKQMLKEAITITKKYECVTAKETKYILEVATQKC